jgi:hypothetical protein
MGLESHIEGELTRAKSGFVNGEHYWFDNGLKTDRIDVAEEIASVLNNTGEFGPATAVAYLDTMLSGVEFDVHPQFKRE